MDIIQIVKLIGITLSVIIFAGFVYKAIQEDNVITISDVAQVVVTAAFIYVIIKNGERETEWQPFSDYVILILISGMYFLGGIRNALPIFNKFKKNGNKD